MTVRKAAVLGSPIEHSKSPQLHLAAYKELGLDWEYEKFDIKADELESFLDGLDDSWAGLSLTMPLKEEALRLSTVASKVARQTGSVNTLVLGDGQRTADNTDVAGLTYAIEQGMTSDKPLVTATVLGTGATARSAVAALAVMGPDVNIRVAGRTPENVERIVAWANDEYDSRTTGHSLQEAENDLLASQVVVSTLPASATAALVNLIPASPQLLVDVVYDPPTNPLADSWVASGGVRVGGLTMLVAQAAEQVRLMTGYEGPLDPLRNVMFDSIGD